MFPVNFISILWDLGSLYLKIYLKMSKIPGILLIDFLSLGPLESRIVCPFFSDTDELLSLARNRTFCSLLHLRAS